MQSKIATAIAAAICATAAACGGPSSGDPGPSQSPHTAVLTASDAQNGRTVTLHVGDSLDITLHSTYWRFAGSSNAAVVAPEASPTVSPSASGCVAGQGCGTVTASFDALAVGTAVIDASRTTCGEALLCTGSAGSYRLTVEVTPAT